MRKLTPWTGFSSKRYLKELYVSRGFVAELTRASGDFGGDLLLSKNGKKVVVQAKRHSKDMDIKAVQEAWVVSNSYLVWCLSPRILWKIDSFLY